MNIQSKKQDCTETEIEKFYFDVSSRLFNEGFYLHSRITVQIFNTEAPVLLFNLLGWGEAGSVAVIYPPETLLTFLTFLFASFFIRIYLTKHHSVMPMVFVSIWAVTMETELSASAGPGSDCSSQLGISSQAEWSTPIGRDTVL